MKATAFVIIVVISEAVSLNKGRGRPKEIAYGSKVDYGIMKRSYPFMARLIMDGGERCGGAVIADRFLATARHCLEGCECFNATKPTTDWTGCRGCIVKLRELNDKDPDHETIHSIKTMHLPRDSGDPYTTHGKTDFAILELLQSVNNCEEPNRDCWPISPVRLVDRDTFISPLQEVRTLGWGATEESDSVSVQSDFLAQLDITVNTSRKLFYNLETNVGAHGADPCAGDSGGPLLMRGEDRSWRLVATLLGGGFNCDPWAESADKTSDWNKVSVHIPWITSIFGGDPQCAREYKVLDEDWRKITYGVKHNKGPCDNNLTPGWYRFKFADRPYAKIPTTVPEKEHRQRDRQSCGSFAVSWMPASLPTIGQPAKEITIYFARASHEKWASRPGKVVACDDGGNTWYLYYLPGTSTYFCDGYCAL